MINKFTLTHTPLHSPPQSHHFVLSPKQLPVLSRFVIPATDHWWERNSSALFKYALSQPYQVPDWDNFSRCGPGFEALYR